MHRRMYRVLALANAHSTISALHLSKIISSAATMFSNGRILFVDLRVSFEESNYRVSESEGQLEKCLVLSVTTTEEIRVLASSLEASPVDAIGK